MLTQDESAHSRKKVYYVISNISRVDYIDPSTIKSDVIFLKAYNNIQMITSDGFGLF
jgi:hypothetical protein